MSFENSTPVYRDEFKISEFWAEDVIGDVWYAGNSLGATLASSEDTQLDIVLSLGNKCRGYNCLTYRDRPSELGMFF
jgi:hypothetical protein